MEPYMVPKGTKESDLTLEQALGLEAKCQEFLSQKKNLQFKLLTKLALNAGFILDRTKGSHEIYKHPQYILDKLIPPSDRMIFQSDNGKAKPYQVEQLIYFIQTAVRKKEL